MKDYLQSHIIKKYLPNPMILSGLKKYMNSSGWEDFYIGNHLLFSHRKTYYSTGMFPEKLHSHVFFEMDIYMEGSISYISDNQEMLPHKNDIMLFPPGCQHTARLLEPGHYERYVFYFSPQFFADMGMTEFPAFFSQIHACFHHIRPDAYPTFCYLLEHLKHTLTQLEHDATLSAFSDVLQLFHLITVSSEPNSTRIMDIPANVRELREYVDQYFKTLQTVNEIAQHFYYSREYVSKIFRQYYNLPLSEYLMIQKINYAKALLTEGKSVTCACSSCGFHSMSSFINAFRKRTGITPSEYKKKKKNN